MADRRSSAAGVQPVSQQQQVVMDSSSTPPLLAAASKDLIFWIRSEIFDFGLLPLSPHSDISFNSLLALVRKYRYTHELNAQYMKAINTLYSTNTSPENVLMRFSEWEIIASEDLLLNTAQTRVYVGLQTHLSFLQNHEQQLSIQPSFGYAFTKGAKWPLPVANQTVSAAAELFNSPKLAASTSSTSSTSSVPSRENKDGSLASARGRIDKKRKIGVENAPDKASPRPTTSEPSQQQTLNSSSALNTSNPSNPSSNSTPRSPSPTLTSSSFSRPGSGASPPRQVMPITPKSSRQRKRSSLALISRLPGSNDLRSRLKSRFHVSLRDQLTFVQEHLGFLLRLLCSDDHQHFIRRSELEPLNFLLAVGYSNYAIHDSNLIDVLPKASTTDKYSNLDLTEWILHRLRINAHLYSLDPSDSKYEELLNASRYFPGKNLVYRPITLIGVHNRTLLRTDVDSIPMRGGMPSLQSLKDLHSQQGANSSGSGSNNTTGGGGGGNATGVPNLNNPGPSMSGDVAHTISGSMNDPVDGRFAHILNCNSSYIYLLCPLSCVKIEHCVGSVIVVGAVSSLISVENCKDTTIITACQNIQIIDCDSCTFYLMTNGQPLVIGNNFGLRFGPYCSHYRSLERHVSEAGLDTTRNFWNRPILYVMELLRDFQPNVPLGNSRHPMRSAPTKMEKMTFALVSPDHFSPFRVPFELHGQTKQIPFPLPSDYQLALEDHTEEAILLKKDLDRVIQDKNQQGQIQLLVRTQFEKWLADSGAMQQIEDLVKLQIQ